MELDLAPFKKIIDLIPKIVSTVKESFEIEITKYIHNSSRLESERCLIKQIVKLMQGKWSIDILHCIKVLGESHYNEIKKELTGIGSRILTNRLRFFEQEGIIKRTIYVKSPIRVSYKLTEYGDTLFLLLVPVFIYNISFKKKPKD